MDLGLRDKVAVIAASSKGLGKAAASGLAKEGANITICARGKDELENTAAEIITETGARVLAVQGDVSDAESVKEIVSKTLEEYSTVHILVNNAGGPPFGTFLDFSIHDWQKAFELNLLSTINFSRLIIPYMKEQKWGRIINITSVAAKQPIEGLILSNTVRAGVMGLAKTLSQELASDNILVNNVCPGRILTDRIIQLAEERGKKNNTDVNSTIGEMERDIPLGRIGDPQELADLIVFLSSERASYITGTTIQVDGGIIKGII